MANAGICDNDWEVLELGMPNYYFIFYFANEGEFGKEKMCKKLEELSNYNIDKLYSMFEEEFSNIPVDIHSVLTKLGIEFGAVDFSKIEGNFDGIILPQQANMVMGAVAAYSNNIDNKAIIKKLELYLDSLDNYKYEKECLIFHIK